MMDTSSHPTTVIGFDKTGGPEDRLFEFVHQTVAERLRELADWYGRERTVECLADDLIELAGVVEALNRVFHTVDCTCDGCAVCTCGFCVGAKGSRR